MRVFVFLAFIMVVICMLMPYYRDIYGFFVAPARKRDLIFILKRFDHMCNHYGIPYVIESGTLLGAVREKNVIDWDDDVDVSVLKEVHNGVDFLWKNRLEIRQRWGLVCEQHPIVFRVRHVSRVGWIDVFERELHTDGYYRTTNGTFPTFLFHKADLFPLTQYDLGPIRVSGPANPFPHLEKAYGPNWRIPVRYCHNIRCQKKHWLVAISVLLLICGCCACERMSRAPHSVIK